MTKYLPFAFDAKGFYPNPKCYIITGEDLLLIVLNSLFNSKIITYYIKTTFPELQGGTRELHKNKFENIPIPDGLLSNTEFVTICIQLNKNIQSFQGNFSNEDWYHKMITMIDSIAYKLYGLNEDDIKLIDKALEQ